jgi:hypothetical protein
MPSNSFQLWSEGRSRSLDEIETAHASVGGTGPGRRIATQQINQAYAVLLASQFQGFCRDLHSECAEHLIAATPVGLREVISEQFSWGRTLDRGNANSGNIGADFNRFGLAFWTKVLADHHQNGRRREYLDQLNIWRNAIAHQDFDPTRLGGTTALHLATVRQWRSSLNGLAISFDDVMRDHLLSLLGVAPW